MVGAATGGVVTLCLPVIPFILLNQSLSLASDKSVSHFFFLKGDTAGAIVPYHFGTSVLKRVYSFQIQLTPSPSLFYGNGFYFIFFVFLFC